MSTSTTICKSCQFENHATCHFCIRCGEPLNAVASSPAKTTVLAELVQDKSDTAPQRDVVESIESMIQQCNFRSRAIGAGFLVEVPLDGERTQKVSILLNEKDRDGEQAVTLVSVCGPAKEKYAMQLLQINAQTKYCAYGVRKVKDRDMFVVSGSQYGATADPEELRKLLITIAKTADRLEDRLTKGGDDF